ncbi:MAG: rod shape-determining protein RodA [Candidatus Nitrohelix vancouverensis]|uniref:Peptidoglycan glycosyltransferase RodA n=1 Tax=Candidatus Nitrohelix vancouverensis TaxID=2705534 RepID=A0A7T0C155_9BACT|nr:MAG: rod shape-determining protein RodA [Candidatus Nitrohelix vancouverensis]
MINPRQLSNFCWWYFLLILGTALVGVVFIYSANHGRPEEFFRNLYIKQLYWILYGFLVMLIAILVDYRLLNRYAYLIYFLTLLALGYVLINGVVASGAKRWIHIGPLTLQVSEFAKFALIIALAKFFETTKMQGQYRLFDLWIPALLTLIIALMIAAQPDLGTALVLFFIFVVFITAIEFDSKTLVKLFVTALAVTPALWLFLKDYQKSRLLTLVNPELDPLGAGYHSIQSKIAIGSGGFWGKGLMAGTQSRLNFLPEKHTDFIFSVFAEESGFIGVAVLLSVYLIIILKGLNIAFRAGDRFGFLLALGIICSLTFYTVFNIGMTIGFFPITGLPLPLLSYGGSSLITNFFAFGLLLNIEMRRTVH